MQQDRRLAGPGGISTRSGDGRDARPTHGSWHALAAEGRVGMLSQGQHGDPPLRGVTPCHSGAKEYGEVGRLARASWSHLPVSVDGASRMCFPERLDSGS